jgi:hypothetical protein
MKKSYLYTIKNVFLFFLIFIYSNIFAQTTILSSQGFQDWNNQVNGSGDSWTYSPTAQSNGIYTTQGSTTPTYLTPRSLKLEQYGGGEDRQIDFSNISVNVASYSSVTFSIAFASQDTDENGTTGRSPDTDEDLFLDYSYNNGGSWTTVKLIDGKASTTSDVFGMGTLPSLNTVVPSGSNPYVLTLNATATQFKVRVRAVFDPGDFDIYWIDDLRLIGIVNNPEIEVSSANNNIANGTTTVSSTNNTDFGVYDINSGVKTRTYTIRNSGTSNLVLGAIPVSFVAGSSNTFTIQSQPTANFALAPNATTTFTIAFNPTALVTTNATISIASNDADENPYTFLVEGNGAEIYPDTDGDGISNNLDADDDNDGISDAYEQTNCLASSGATVVETIFLDENFGAGLNRVRINGTTPGVTTNYCFEDGTTAQAADECNTNVDLNDGKYTVHYSITDANGTTQISNTAPDTASWAEWAWVNTEDHTPGDTNGRMAIFNAAYTPGIFYQTTVTGILPNVPINYSFWAINIDNNDAAFGGASRILPNVTVNFYTTDFATLLGTFNTGNITRCTSGNACIKSLWKQFLTNININQTEFIIQFVNNSPGGGGNDLAIDDIKITQTLCDIDADGIADVLDLDNDNDGIPNIVEARMIANPDTDNNATTSGTGWVDANNNGWSDAFETANPVDSDGDGIKDYLDLDSDNDGIFDAVEYDGNGDIDVNGDGLGEGNDIKTPAVNDEFDGDGILGIADDNDSDVGSDDHGTGYPIPLDSDNDGLPNYIDVYNNTTAMFDISQTIYASYDTNNNGIIDGTGDNDEDGILNVFDTNDSQEGSPRDLSNKYSLFFDGRNDYIEEPVNIVSGLSQATMMAWIKLDNTFSNEGVVMGQDKFLIKINNQLRTAVEINGSTVALNGSVNNLPLNKWVHVAAVFDGPNNSQTVRIYVNGELKSSTSSTSTIQASANNLFRIGRNPLTAGTGYFKGEIEEVRVFNTALTDDQLQRIVYQELKDTNFAIGDVIPLAIPSLSASSLIRYYKMDTFKNDIVDNKVTPSIDTGSGARLYNIKDLYKQTAPLPFETVANGAWSLVTNWKYGSVWDINTNIRPWSIVNIKNDITANSNIEMLGLMIDNTKKLTINGDAELKNNWYLKLDGKLDLEGKSQLVQTSSSQLDPTSSGSLERDQKGVKNFYNYNYWCSPVSTINATINNNGYTVAGVMKDGTNPASIQNINWVGGYDGSNTSPLSVANYWIYKFQNVTNTYAGWTQIGSTGALLSGQGYTMKGNGANVTGAVQNYTFVGKPNNGTIINAVAANNINLSGNPYPSALDSQEFIKDNIDGVGANPGSSGALKGTIYLWQHANENNSHLLASYRGGYAALNLTGGVAPVYETGTFGVGTSSRIPNRYIPVGQGFFVSGDASGGNVTFKNGQRAFKIETDVASNVLFKSTSQKKESNVEETFKKVRLGFTTVDNYKRQVLLGFMEANATDAIDPGYDAKGIDSNNPSDMYFLAGTDKLIIQGVGDFADTNIYPLGVKSDLAGNIKFTIDATENFVTPQQMYIHDAETNQYYDVTTNPVEININAGTFDNRFSLRFKTDAALGIPSQELNNGFNVFYNDNVLNIKNSLSDVQLNAVLLFNMLGQEVSFWNLKNQTQSEFKLPVSEISSGTYIVKIKTSNGDVTKKIIVN